LPFSVSAKMHDACMPEKGEGKKEGKGGEKAQYFVNGLTPYLKNLSAIVLPAKRGKKRAPKKKGKKDWGEGRSLRVLSVVRKNKPFQGREGKRTAGAHLLSNLLKDFPHPRKGKRGEPMGREGKEGPGIQNFSISGSVRTQSPDGQKRIGRKERPLLKGGKGKGKIQAKRGQESPRVLFFLST